MGIRTAPAHHAKEILIKESLWHHVLHALHSHPQILVLKNVSALLACSGTVPDVKNAPTAPSARKVPLVVKHAPLATYPWKEEGNVIVQKV